MTRDVRFCIKMNPIFCVLHFLTCTTCVSLELALRQVTHRVRFPRNPGGPASEHDAAHMMRTRVRHARTGRYIRTRVRASQLARSCNVHREPHYVFVHTRIARITHRFSLTLLYSFFLSFCLSLSVSLHFSFLPLRSLIYLSLSLSHQFFLRHVAFPVLLMILLLLFAASCTISFHFFLFCLQYYEMCVIETRVACLNILWQ